jgi:hypothetical protein
VRLAAQKVYISNLWIADVAHQGQSGVLNEEQLGDDRESSNLAMDSPISN